MVAIYSYWDLNLNYRVVKEWYRKDFKYLTLALSVYHSLKLYDRVEMITTTPMKKLFEELEIPFTKISTELDDLKVNKKLWILGKIKAYSIQEEPFVHIDNDFILYEKPIFNSSILVQEFESFNDINHMNGYGDKLYKSRANFSNKPKLFDVTNKSFCMGIYAVNDINFNKLYCNTILNLIDDNKDYILSQTDATRFGIILEQYMLSTLTEENNIDVEEINVNFLHLLENKYNHKYYDYIKNEVMLKLPNVYNKIKKRL
jgi:hypothetical protein